MRWLAPLSCGFDSYFPIENKELLVLLKLRLFFLLFCLASLVPTDSNAQTVVRQATFQALNSALQNMRTSGGNIEIDLPAGSVISTGAPFATFQGNNRQLSITSKRRVVIDGRNRTGLFQIAGRNSTISFNNITFRNATRNDLSYGGAIGTRNTDTNSTIRVDNCRFVNCRETKDYAGGGGGAIRVRIGNNLFVEDSQFFYCRGASGGAIATTDSNVEIRRCHFEGNRSFGALDGPLKGFRQFNAAGGAVRIDGLNEIVRARPVVVRACTFIRNIAPEVPKGATRFNVAPAALNIYTSETVRSGATIIFRSNVFRGNRGPFHTARVRINDNGRGTIDSGENTFQNNATRLGNSQIVVFD